MKDFLSKLKGLVSEEIPDAAPQVEKSFGRPTPTLTIKGSVAPVQDIDIGSINTATVSDKVIELRRQIVPAQGPLFVFISTLAALEPHISNEAVRFNAAIQTLAPQGITADSISASIASVFGGLEEHKVKTETARANKFKSQVTDKQVHASALTTQIEEMQKALGKLATEKERLEREVDEAANKIKERSWEWEKARATY